MSKTSTSHIELDGFWAYQVTVLADHISRYTLGIVRAEADLNQSQWRVLAAVADKPGCTAAEVTAVTPMDKTIVSRAVSSLIDSGHIKKTPHETDKRRLSLQTTASGLKIYKRIATKLNQSMVISLSNTALQKDFVDTLKDFISRMDNLEA